MLLVVDTREQKPYSFAKYDAEVMRAALPAADYSLPGFEDRVVVERKSVNDLIGCLTKDRARFERELAKLRTYELAAVVIEASMQDIANGAYRSDMKPHAALQSIFALQVRHGVPFIFAGNRAGGEYATYSLLEKYLSETEKRYQAATKGQNQSREEAEMN